MTDTHWSKDRTVKRVHLFFWCFLFTILMVIRWASPIGFDIVIAMMATTAALRIAILEVDAGI